MTEDTVLRRAIIIGPYMCEIEMTPPKLGDVTTVNFVWSPDIPRTMTPEQLHEYQTKRDAVLAEFGEMVGLRVAVVEFDGGRESIHMVDDSQGNT